MIAQHITDLAVLAVGATQEIADIASRRGLRAARVLAIRREVDRRFADPDFSLPVLAQPARHHARDTSSPCWPRTTRRLSTR